MFTGASALLMFLGMEPFWTLLAYPFLAWVMFAIALIPPELFPRWLELVAKFVPSTLGISATCRILVEGASVADLAGDGSLGWLALHTIILVAGGWVAYQWQIRRALRDGRMGPG